MSRQQTYKSKVYPADKALPENLQLWLNNNNFHGTFSTYEWFFALSQFKSQHQNQAQTIYCWFFVFDDEEPRIAMAFEKNSTKLKAMSNFYTPFWDIFFDQSAYKQSEAWAILLHQLTSTYPDWLSLEVTPVFPLQLVQIQHAVSAFPLSMFQYSFSVNYQTQYSDFQNYWEQRSSKLKNTYQRRLKSLKKNNFNIDIFHKFSEEVKQIYWQVYQRSWKIPEPSKSFINWLMNWASQEQKLQLGVLYIDGHPAACQLWLLDKNTASIYKLAQDKNFDSFSPGTVLTKHMIEQLSERLNIRSVDFLLGNDEFKSLWMDSKTDVIGIEIINKKTFNGKILSCLYQLRDLIKKYTGINFSRNRIAK